MVGRVPRGKNIDQKKKMGTLILTSLREDLVGMCFDGSVLLTQDDSSSYLHGGVSGFSGDVPLLELFHMCVVSVL